MSTMPHQSMSSRTREKGLPSARKLESPNNSALTPVFELFQLYTPSLNLQSLVLSTSHPCAAPFPAPRALRPRICFWQVFSLFPPIPVHAPCLNVELIASCTIFQIPAFKYAINWHGREKRPPKEVGARLKNSWKRTSSC